MQKESPRDDLDKLPSLEEGLISDKKTFEEVKEDLPSPLLISDTARNTIRDFLRTKLSGDEDGCYFFRRFDKLISSSPPISIVRHFGPDVYETLDSISDLDADTIKKNVEIKHKWFSGFTTARSIRDEHDILEGKEIYVHSGDYSQIDMSLNYTFKFSEARQLSSHISPRSEDLLFIYISNKNILSFSANKSQSGRKKIKPKADAWCIVSEQFLRAWTLIQFDWHESFDNYIAIGTPFSEREKALRDKLFIGNKLMTNSWLKHKLALEADNKIMTIEESREKYWYLRTEYVSRKWVDVYAALVLIARYGELPCPVNVPNNSCMIGLKLQQHRKVWSLPDVFVTMVLHKCARSLIITDHLHNYENWKNHSQAPTMLSIHGKQRGFLDDIHQIVYNPQILCKEVVPFSFPLLSQTIGMEKDVEDTENNTDAMFSMGTWAHIVKTGTINTPIASLNITNDSAL